MGIDPRTVSKYANQEEFKVKPKQKRKARVMGPVKPIIDKWIKEDLKKKRKYQRTAKKMYEQLCDFHSFKGSDRTVRDYVSKRKRELKEPIAALPLESFPGTAQVNFGEAPFKYHSEIIDLPYLVLSFPYSNCFYFQVFLRKTQNAYWKVYSGSFIIWVEFLERFDLSTYLLQLRRYFLKEND